MVQPALSLFQRCFLKDGRMTFGVTSCRKTIINCEHAMHMTERPTCTCNAGDSISLFLRHGHGLHAALGRTSHVYVCCLFAGISIHLYILGVTLELNLAGMFLHPYCGHANTSCKLQVVLKHGTEAMNFVELLPGRWSGFIRGTDRPK